MKTEEIEIGGEYLVTHRVGRTTVVHTVRCIEVRNAIEGRYYWFQDLGTDEMSLVHIRSILALEAAV